MIVIGISKSKRDTKFVKIQNSCAVVSPIPENFMERLTDTKEFRKLF